jgi:hypothetical protein
MTKEELKQLSNNTFIDNNTGEIEPAEHRNFNDHLIESLLPTVDLASTTEQLTGELYNGSPVYVKNYLYGVLDSVATVPVNVANNSILPADVATVWIDYNLSFGYEDGFNGIRRNAVPSMEVSGSDIFGASLNGKMLSMMGSSTLTVDINLCFKYTKAS